MILIAAILGLSAVLVAGSSFQQQRRVKGLESALIDAGCDVNLRQPVWEVLWQRWWTGPSFPNWTSVCFDNREVDGAWLRSHDNLRDIDLDALLIHDSSFTGDDVAALAVEHPLEQFSAWSVPNMDSVAAALGGVSTLRVLDVCDSDLTDDGFRQLPLEQLNAIDIHGTQVTAAGLLELRRCQELRSLTLDGRQFDADVLEVLENLPHVNGLLMSGRSVTDEDLSLLHGTRLKFVRLHNTAVTTTGIDELKAVASECRVEVSR